MKPKRVRVLKAEIALEIPEYLFRQKHGEKGETMTDADLKYFFLDSFSEMIKKDCREGFDIRKYMYFSFIEEWKEN